MTERDGDVRFVATQETQRGLDFRGRLADTIDNIFSPQDQPQGLLRGSVFLGEAKIVEGMPHAR